ncbi:hypothetical protein DFH09DRAFT_441711 [Mycena vulgaris]|nr:hypothetical protein DFH09DRAFT_441711 [Mycena vulgaris]
MLKLVVSYVLAVLLVGHHDVLAGKIDLVARDVRGFGNITSANWIWAKPLIVAPPFVNASIAGFRSVYTSPAGKTAVIANCQAAGVNNMTFYVNGAASGQGSIKNVVLNPFSNLFAIAVQPQTVNVTNTHIGGFIAACQIVFSDGTMNTITTSTDGSWHAAPLAGSDLTTFMAPVYYENATWVAAALIGTFASAPFPGVTFPVLMPPPVNFNSTPASWIWTNEANPPAGLARPFRFKFSAPQFDLPLAATVVVTCDNSYTFWLNGNLIAVSPTATDWTVAQRYVVPLQTTTNVLAFAGYNLDVGSSAAALIVSIQVQLASGALLNFVTDQSWRTLNGPPPPNFQSPTFDDSAWNFTTVQGRYGVSPWGTSVIIPPLTF